jgi:hypothetical protein
MGREATAHDVKPAVTPWGLRRRTAAPPDQMETVMLRFRTLAVTAAAVVGLSGGALVASSGSAAGAAADPVIGKQVLDMLCRSKAGTAYTTPFTISRCQEARPGDGFVIEQLICEGLVDGTFSVVTSPNRPSRANWSCVSGPITD